MAVKRGRRLPFKGESWIPPRQKVFVAEYCKTHQAEKSALKAGYEPRFAKNTAYQLLQDPKVFKVQQGLQELKVFKVQQDLQVLPALRDQLDCKVQQV